MRHVGALALILGALVVSTGRTWAQAPQAAASFSSAEPACPEGNLLERRRPWAVSDVRGNLTHPTDGAVAPEGAVWNAPVAVILDTAASTLTWDLGAVTTVRVAYIQADANDYYTVWGSLDGQAWNELGRIAPVDGHGLRARRLNLGGGAVRFIRFGEGEGDNFYSLSEIQVFCQVPTPFPPKLRVETLPAAQVKKGIFHYWNNDTSARWELALALLGFALLHWGFVLRRQGRPEARRKLRDRLLATLGVLAALTYVNFGSFHFGNYIHDWEWTHYYVGSKYFREVGYDRLYECIAIADAEDGLRRRVEKRKLTNLRNNLLEPSTEILAHPQRCKQHFTDARWEAFKHDVRFFRGRQNAKRWDDLQTDHGYNGTPVWNVAGTLLANLSPASKTQLYALSLLDPLYLLATMAVVWWAFGWRVLAVALLAFATNFPSRFYWTGGAFLRWDWLFYTVAAICCLRKDRPLLGGMALTYATLLRVFPGFVFVGPLLAMGWHLYKHRALEPRYTRFFVGAALGVALLVPVSLQVSGGIGAYQQFMQNTVKHKETPLTNYMGLRTVVAWRPSEVGRVLRNDKLVDPWLKWKEARLAAFREAKPVYAVVVVAFLVLLGLAVRRAQPWAATAMGITFIPIGVELTCYYYAFILGVALLWEKREEVGRWLLLLTAFTQFVAWAPLRTMSRWLDEQYTLMSAATVAVFGAILWLFREPGSPKGAGAAPDSEAPAPAAQPPKPPSGTTAPPRTRSAVRPGRVRERKKKKRR
jgi:hypothetical protein